MWTKWQSSRRDQRDRLMKGDAQYVGFDAGWWKASHAACSATVLLMLVMLKVGACLDVWASRERRSWALAMSLFWVVMPS